MKTIRIISAIVGVCALVLCTAEWSGSFLGNICSLGVFVLSTKAFTWADERIGDVEE